VFSRGGVAVLSILAFNGFASIVPSVVLISGCCF
jgi:hypothetical protein